MRARVHLCDLCLAGKDKVRLAHGRWWSDETQTWWDACRKHLNVSIAQGCRVEGYDNLGNLKFEELG